MSSILIRQNLMTREIAKQLTVGVSTVSMYRARIKRKLNLENVARLGVEAQPIGAARE